MNLLIFNLKTDAHDPVLGFTTDWINALSRHCEQVHVITMQSGKLETADNVRVWSVGKEKGYGKLRRVWEFYKILIALTGREKFQGCFAHMQTHFSILAWPVLKLKKIPLALWYAHKATPWHLKLALRLCDFAVTASAESLRIASPKVQVIGHGIDTRLFKPLGDLKPEIFTILSAGRIARIKNLDVLIDAVSGLKPDTFKLKIAGSPLLDTDQKYFEKLKNQIAELKLESRVEFLGAKTYHQMPEVYAGADCLVHLSDTDSVDKSVLEAMSCGLPVITSNAAFKPMLQARWPWTCVPKGDVIALQNQIREIMQWESSKRQKLGNDLRQEVCLHHNLEQCCTRILQLFKKS